VTATWDHQGADAGAFVYRHAGVQALLEESARLGDRFRVLDRAGWVIADTGSVVPKLAAAAPRGLAERFFRYVLRRDDVPYADLENPPGRVADTALRRVLVGDSAVAWYREGPDASAIVAATAPIRGSSGGIEGAVLLEQASDPILTLTNRALLDLLSFTLAVSLSAALGLLAYASLLSFRIRRLARAAETALGPEGTINVTLPGSASRDEIGDLSRSFGDVLGRLRDYTEYLRTLAAKLTHELRTPLAIVSTSLDNLEHEVREPGAAPYLERLRDGAARLDSILVAMSAATRIEQAINETEAEDFDLARVVTACATAYQDVYRERIIACNVPVASPVRGSSELVAQLLDKLVENAVSFSPAGSTIALEVAETPSAFVLSVSNRGPPLPAAMRHQLFDSLVSVRAHGDGRAHLGLGLYVVALIARFHRARVMAEDLADGSGVVFRVNFPRPG
jgi:signal transduction histidine kinase